MFIKILLKDLEKGIEQKAPGRFLTGRGTVKFGEKFST